MERDKNFSDRTPSREQEPVPQAGGHDRRSEERKPADDAEVDKDTNEGMKDASGKSPRGDV
ncbi:hypothetical protein [Rhizobium sp. 2MFCol3.1]|uniref:hypothetical protein n=1 Tax=Rhizobium sp. 2MFCol3.1 TaxID=1246459 RepID=UPI00036515E3|nr:hypothetical protein [Rhizobium sp. 2MFCol3.1]